MASRKCTRVRPRRDVADRDAESAHHGRSHRQRATPLRRHANPGNAARRRCRWKGHAALCRAASAPDVHAEDGVRLSQKNAQSGSLLATSSLSHPSRGGAQTQDIEMTAPVMDFIVKDGRLLENAETSGPPRIVITQPDANQKTVVTAARFTAKFTDKNRLATLHGRTGCEDSRQLNRSK